MSLPEIWEDIRQSREEKLQESRLWDLIRAFLEDRQNQLAFDLRNNQITASSTVATYNPGGRGRVQFNVLKPVYRTLASLLSTNVPGIRTIPASPSIEDIVKSEATMLAGQYYWRDTNIQQTVGSKLVPWLLATGNGFLCTKYSPQRKKVITECPSPYDVYPEPGCIDPDEVNWWAIKQLIRKKDLQAAYPDHAKEIDDYAQEATRDQMGLFQDSRLPKDRVDVYTVYWRDGRYGVCIGKTWLFGGDGDTYVPEGTTPLVFIRYTHFAGKLWGHSPFVSAIDLQTTYNRRRNMELDAADQMANPVWLVPTGSVTNVNSISNKPGKVIPFNPVAGAPTRVPGVSMPPDFSAGTQQLVAEIYDMLGIHSVTLGKRAIGVTSGKGMEVLANNDISQLQMTMNAIENGLMHVAKTAILFMREYYPEGVMVRMMDQTGKVISQQLQQTDFQDSPEVYFEASSLFRMESEDMDAQTLGLFDRKLLDADEARKRLSFRVADYKATEKMRSWAHARKLLAAAAGLLGDSKGIEIFPTDDLTAIGQVFQEFMQTDDYYALPPERQDYIAAVLAALSSNGQMTPDQLAEASHKKIWPPQPKKPQDAREMVIATDSQIAQQQVVDERAMMAQHASEIQQSQAEAAPTSSMVQ